MIEEPSPQEQQSPGQESPQLSSSEQPRRSVFQGLPPVAFAFVSLAIVFFLYQIIAGGLTLLLFRGNVTKENVQLVRWATLVGQLVFILLPTILLARLRQRDVVRYLRLRVPDYKEIVLTFIAVFALQQMLQSYMLFQDALPISLPPELKRLVEQLKQMIEETYRVLVTSHSPIEYCFVVIVVALIPAICEELLFRGLVQRSFEEATTGMRAAIIAGVIFGSYHLNPFSFVPLVVLGIYFGLIVYRSQNIVLSMSVHFFNNFVACTAAYMQLDDDFVAIAPHHQVTPALVFANGAVFSVVFVVATYYFIRVTEPAVPGHD
jgi:membrane protease YdiL (CAAX protease family)